MIEEYNEYGEIIKSNETPPIYERKLTTHQQHRIHQTKDLFEGDCYLCRQDMEKKIQTYWGDDE